MSTVAVFCLSSERIPDWPYPWNAAELAVLSMSAAVVSSSLRIATAITTTSRLMSGKSLADWL